MLTKTFRVDFLTERRYRSILPVGTAQGFPSILNSDCSKVSEAASMTLRIDSCPKDVIGRFWPASLYTFLNGSAHGDSRSGDLSDHAPIGIHRNIQPNNGAKV
jgi:hypothetical protein